MDEGDRSSPATGLVIRRRALLVAGVVVVAAVAFFFFVWFQPHKAFIDDEVAQGAVNLGRLKGNLGDQNYEVPADVDLDGLSTVFIWCDRFSVVFGAAGLA